MLEELARQHRTLMRDDYGREVAPCPLPAYEGAKTRFKSKFGFELPYAYWGVMGVCVEKSNLSFEINNLRTPQSLLGVILV